MSEIAWSSETRRLSDLVAWERNPRQIRKDEAERLLDSLERFGQIQTIAIGPESQIYDGHQRQLVWAASQKFGPDYEVDVRVSSRALTEKERQQLVVYLHRGTMGEWNWDSLANSFDVDDLLDWGFTDAELGMAGFDLENDAPEDPGPQIDKAAELQEKWGTTLGQLWELGEHRLICGNCTDKAVVERVMGGKLARMIFTDPPYGIGKDIINDNLRREEWTEFYRAFTTTMLTHLIDNGYFYVWGYFETLSDYWQDVVKPRGDCNFRNFIIWKKTFVQGKNSDEFRQYPEHYGACLLMIYGMPFQNGPWSVSPNAEHYPEIFEPIRSYLDGERKRMDWDIPTVKKMVGHSDLSGDHWFGRSQWTMPTREVYEKLQRNAKNDAFRKEYDELRKEYDELRKEYDEFRKEYDEFRGHFDNSFGFTDIWELDGLTVTSLHPTVKPIEVCERGILTNSKDDEIVLDVFLGSGSTLIACERLGRKCRGIEIEPKYVAVTLDRWARMTGREPVLVEG